MISPQDIQGMGDADKVAFLLAALNASEARADALAAENSKAAADMSALAAAMASEIEGLKGELESARRALANVVEQIKLANQQRFGSSSEKVDPDQLSLFNDFEQASDSAAPEPDAPGPREGVARRRGGGRVIDYSRFETVVIDHGLPEGERACPGCGGALEEMNIEVTRRIRIVPAHLEVEEHRRRVYRCPSCCSANAAGRDRKSVIVRAPQPAPPVPGSFATPSLIAWLINGKYVNSLPLYRMEAELGSLGAPISRANMANWVIGCHERWLALIRERMRAELLSHDLVHADETVVQVLKEPGREAKRKSRMWLFCSAACDTPVYIFQYDETRAKRVAGDFLRGWAGTLTTDGYGPYFNLGLPGVTNVACGVHIRRYFARIVKNAGGDAAAAACGSVALEARRRIDRIFREDAKLDAMAAAGDWDGRRRARERLLRPLMEDFYAWAQTQLPKASPKLALHRALEYAVTFWPHFMNVLSDGRLELDNNIAERAQRPFVVGRKNWLFSDTPRGAEASAAIYSIVTTAKANGLNPRLYVQWLLEEVPNAGELSGAAADRFLPWSAEVPESCKLPPEKAAKACEFEDDPIIDIDPDIENDEMENNRKEGA